MREALIKTHLIITDVHDEYHMKWCGKIREADPAFNEMGLPMFAIIGSDKRINVSTVNMSHLEKCAKALTSPKGRSAVSTDTARVYIVEKNGNEKLLGVMTHNRVKKFAPMYDKVGIK